MRSLNTRAWVSYTNQLTRDEYFKLIDNLIENQIGPDKIMETGKIYHHIVFKLLSLDADNESYNSADYSAGDQYRCLEQHKFYRILAGELDNHGQPLSASVYTAC